MPSLKKVREEAWEFYQEWRKEKTYSPALKSEIRVSLKGWAHLSGSDRARRKRIYMDRRVKITIKNGMPHPLAL